MESSGWLRRKIIEGAPSCPRCASSNTKFCYFNNYSFSQPRYFCKSCRRYWTKGGSLRNVPVGGASRKSRAPKPSRLSPKTSRLSISVVSCSHDTPNSGGSHIDMALLFSKFFNPMNGSSESCTPESVEAQNDEIRGPSDAVTGCDPVDLIEGISQQEAAQSFSGHELEGLFVGDEVIQDVLWSDVTTSSAFVWQPPSPMMAFPHELEYSIPFHDDHQLPITSTVLPSI
ncbi:hypothetical protein K1719_040474 [Acacia pycnantha]|nr:hypothetical protein K1719_040474 [Acacia pycnantha]